MHACIHPCSRALEYRYTTIGRNFSRSLSSSVSLSLFWLIIIRTITLMRVWREREKSSLLRTTETTTRRRRPTLLVFPDILLYLFLVLQAWGRLRRRLQLDLAKIVLDEAIFPSSFGKKDKFFTSHLSDSDFDDDEQLGRRLTPNSPLSFPSPVWTIVLALHRLIAVPPGASKEAKKKKRKIMKKKSGKDNHVFHKRRSKLGLSRRVKRIFFF